MPNKTNKISRNRERYDNNFDHNYLFDPQKKVSYKWNKKLDDKHH